MYCLKKVLFSNLLLLGVCPYCFSLRLPPSVLLFPNHDDGFALIFNFFSGAAIGASSAFFILPRLHTSTQAAVDSKKRMKESTKSSHDTSHESTQLSERNGLSSSQRHLLLPQGVVVSVIVNLIGVSVQDVTEEIAHIFDRVVLD